MAIQRFHEFHRDVPYYTGAGCLVCGTNLGPCVDLGVEDAIDGRIVLCEDHARECGVHAGMVPQAELDKVLTDAADAERRAEEAFAAARADRKEAAEDRAVVERILGRLREHEDEKAKAKPATPRAKKAAE